MEKHTGDMPLLAKYLVGYVSEAVAVLLSADGLLSVLLRYFPALAKLRCKIPQNRATLHALRRRR
jgi:hypothetical protein